MPLKRRQFLKRLGTFSAAVGAIPLLGLAQPGCDDGDKYTDNSNYTDYWDYQEAYEDWYADTYSDYYPDGDNYADYLNAGADPQEDVPAESC